MNAQARAAVEERLRAYISPNAPGDPAQEAAFERAVDAQAAYEEDGGALPAGAAAFAIGNYSVTLAEPAGAAYTGASLCPAAWAILHNAGLLRRDWPQARRI